MKDIISLPYWWAGPDYQTRREHPQPFGTGGAQMYAYDVNGDKLPDIVAGNKRGTFVHLHEKKAVSQ